MNTDLKRSYSGKKILITGGLGFIGSTIARRLVQLGAKVSMLDSMMSVYGANYYNIADIQNDIILELGDARNYLTVERLAADSDYVIHLAAQVSYIDSRNMPVEDMEINCQTLLNVLEACRKNNPECVVGFSSSRMVYGKILETPTNEDHPRNPLSLYGIHKQTCEQYLKYFYQEFGLKSVAFRISNPYGPRQQMKHNKYSIAGWFIRMAMENKEISVFGDGKQIRDYIYINDLVEGFLHGLGHPDVTCDVFNLGSGEGIAFIDMIRIIIEKVGSGTIKMIPWPEDYERIETGDYISNQNKLIEFCGFKPQVGIRNGVENTFAYYRDNRDRYW